MLATAGASMVHACCPRGTHVPGGLGREQAVAGNIGGSTAPWHWVPSGPPAAPRKTTCPSSAGPVALCPWSEQDGQDARPVTPELKARDTWPGSCCWTCPVTAHPAISAGPSAFCLLSGTLGGRVQISPPRAAGYRARPLEKLKEECCHPQQIEGRLAGTAPRPPEGQRQGPVKTAWTGALPPVSASVRGLQTPRRRPPGHA